MKGVSVLFFLGICTSWTVAVFLNHRPFPTYSLENMPDTSFSCREKILGGYYADADAQCQMFHVCVKVSGIGVQDFRFLCPNGTAFDQDHQICAEWEDIDCDATTLYYSSDNFDLYRLGSGFESKSQKYGEDEEPFALQRAETGDARINREQQSKVVDQTKPPKYYNKVAKYNNNNSNNNNNNNNEKEIFKSASSSNFYNNRNNGKERDEDYDDNVNINQNQDYEQKRKVNRNRGRRPVQNNNRKSQNDYNQDNRNTEYNRNQNNDFVRNNNKANQKVNDNTSNQSNLNTDYRNYNRNENNDNRNYNRNEHNANRNDNRNENNDNNNYQQQTSRTRRPSNKYTGFSNNFAGSYEPTTSKPTSTTLNAEQYTTAINNYKNRNSQRQQQTSELTDSPVYTISTPAPFRQQYNSPPSRSTSNNQYTSTPLKTTDYSNPSTNVDEHYDIPKVKPSSPQYYDNQYDVPKVRPASSSTTQFNTQKTTASQYESTKIKPSYKATTSEKTENYPSNNPRYNYNFEKKSTTPFKQTDNYPTTLNPKPFSASNNFPTTFAPRTNAGYSQLAQQTSTYNQNRQNTQNNVSSSFNSTPRSTPFTQYTPTVPKLSSTTPVSKSSRFDETQYDDGSYSSKYDYDGDKRDDEFLKTAHSQNIAASRNELQRNHIKQQQTTQSLPQSSKTTYDVPKTYPSTPKLTSDIPKTYPSTSRTSQTTEATKTSAQPSSKKPTPPKRDYDYAYYDSAAGSEQDYELDADIKKSTARN